MSSSLSAGLAELSAHLAQRRDAILSAWRASVSADPTLTTGASLPKAQLNDHIPALLSDFEQQLASGATVAARSQEVLDDDDAAAHGLHRWQQGFDLAEVTRELGRLNECVTDELERYAAAQPAPELAVMSAARRLWAERFGTTVSISASQYFRLQQMEARSHANELERALEGLRELEQQRAQLWQEAAHDLRGNLGVVVQATAGLSSAKASDGARQAFLRMLDRNVSALHLLLDDVTSLARLQGGQERRELQSIDAVALLGDLCERMQARAGARDLTLSFAGPERLQVQGDPVKLARIAQNLLLNALKYTREGGVTVTCGARSGPEDTDRWFLQVSDTGPGFQAGPGSHIAGALEAATDQSKQVSADAHTGAVTHVTKAAAEVAVAVAVAVAVDRPGPAQPAAAMAEVGEGLGLSIVKRLCELLDATVEFESVADVGTSVRVLIPRHYGTGPE